MRTLILSCNTGAGHLSCALALQEQYRAQGEACDIVDALQFISAHASRFISRWHTRIYRHAPRLFSAGYRGAEQQQDLFREGTLLYQYITSGTERLYGYIRAGGYDNVVCTHIFPALALSEVCRRHGELDLVTSHVSTDYTCSPGLADSSLAHYFVPDASLFDEFERCGIPRDRLVASGIPVRGAFSSDDDRAAARGAMGVAPDARHLLMMCGSMGCGPMEELAARIASGLAENELATVICGTNDALRASLSARFGENGRLRVLGVTHDVPALMHSADLFLTKPGGLSTSEAAAAGLPMVLIDAVAGCEEHNLAFFLRRGAALTADTSDAVADTALALLRDDVRLRAMQSAARALSPARAARLICDLTHTYADEKRA